VTRYLQRTGSYQVTTARTGRPLAARTTGEVEVDEGFLGGRDTDLRGGRQRDGKPLVGVAVEVRGKGSGRLRLQLLPDASARSLTSFVRSSVAPGAIVHTDGWQGYSGLRAAGFDHQSHKQRARFADREWVLPRAHRALSNLKTWLQGTHHGVSPKHLQVYLDEFVFRHNRRRTPLAGFPNAARTRNRSRTHHLPPDHPPPAPKPPYGAKRISMSPGFRAGS